MLHNVPSMHGLELRTQYSRYRNGKKTDDIGSLWNSGMNGGLEKVGDMDHGCNVEAR